MFSLHDGRVGVMQNWGALRGASCRHNAALQDGVAQRESQPPLRRADVGARGRGLRGASGLGRDRWFLRLGEGKEAIGVQRDAVLANFEVQMRAGRAARLAECTDALAL